MKVLVTFLGRVTKGTDGYRKTIYHFSDNSKSETSFFGWSLQERVMAEKIIILGTSGSMWDSLFETDLKFNNCADNERIELMESVSNGQVTQEELDSFSLLLSEKLDTEVQLKIIPYGYDENEQIELLRTMALSIDKNDSVHLDVTHGFRHLPMLALLSTFHLRLVRNATVDGIWYGSFNPENGSASVWELSGLLKISDWIQALTTYDKDGDYSVFSLLLPKELSELLEEASFLESMNHLGPARGKIKKAQQTLSKIESENSLSGLFYPELIKRLSWANKDNFYQRQRAMTYQYLEKGRYLNAVLTGYEAFITRLVQKMKLDPANTAFREEARDDFSKQEKQYKPRRKKYKAWDELRRLRNTMVHGGQSKGASVQRALSSEPEMKSMLSRIFDVLLIQDL